MTWTTVKIGDIAQVKGGKRLPEGMSVQDMVTHYPYIRVTDFDSDGVNLNSIKFISKEAHEATSRYIINCTDVYISIAGTIGLVGIVPKQLDGANLTENAAKICEISEDINPQFLMYFLRSRIGQGLINAQVVGTSQPKLALFRIKDIDVPAPERAVQDEIVNVLSKYDNLIENNNRRIAILEEMAQLLYREWFVKFRYPNHQDKVDADGKTKLIDSPLGQIPERWAVKRLDEVADINPQSITQRNAPEKIGYIDISSVGTGVIDDVKPMLFNEAPSRARRVVVDGDIIWATVRPNRKQYSFICKPLPNTIVSTGFAVIRAKTLPASYLYSFTTTDSFTGYLVNHATGSAYPAVNSDIFQKADILVPPKKLVEQFDTFCSRVIELSEVLKKKNKNLKQQRDMLLPKLISGQIEL